MTDLEWREKLVGIVRTWCGTPYLHQASVKHIGCDCLGLLRGVWRELYGDEPELAPPYAPRWTETTEQDLLQIMADRYFMPKRPDEMVKMGDVMLFKYRQNMPARHVGIATFDAKFIHAYVGRGVVENRLSPWWLRHMSGHYSWHISQPTNKLTG